MMISRNKKEAHTTFFLSYHLGLSAAASTLTTPSSPSLRAAAETASAAPSLRDLRASAYILTVASLLTLATSSRPLAFARAWTLDASSAHPLALASVSAPPDSFSACSSAAESAASRSESSAVSAAKATQSLLSVDTPFADTSTQPEPSLSAADVVRSTVRPSAIGGGLGDGGRDAE